MHLPRSTFLIIASPVKRKSRGDLMKNAKIKALAAEQAKARHNIVMWWSPFTTLYLFIRVRLSVHAEVNTVCMVHAPSCLCSRMIMALRCVMHSFACIDELTTL
jgi:hypothetical protein